jgi:hypothetical protein
MTNTCPHCGTEIQSDSKPASKDMNWYIQTYLTGPTDDDLEFIACMLKEPMLQTQNWATQYEGLNHTTTAFTLRIKYKNDQQFYITLQPEDHTFIRYFQEYYITPNQLAAPSKGLSKGNAQSQFDNIKAIWEQHYQVQPVDPFEL